MGKNWKRLSFIVWGGLISSEGELPGKGRGILTPNLNIIIKGHPHSGRLEKKETAGHRCQIGGSPWGKKKGCRLRGQVIA